MLLLLQIKNILAPGVVDPHGTWHECKLDINNCSSAQLQIMQGDTICIFIMLLWMFTYDAFLTCSSIKSYIKPIFKRNVCQNLISCRMPAEQCAWWNFFAMAGFRTEFLNALPAVESSSSRGFFINSCYAHCQSEMQEAWFAADSPMLGKIVSSIIVGIMQHSISLS